MCGWGAGGESGPGSGRGVGRLEAQSWGADPEGRCQGNSLAGQEVSLWHGLEGVEGEFQGISQRSSLGGTRRRGLT